jgi:hypothetical protein
VLAGNEDSESRRSFIAPSEIESKAGDTLARAALQQSLKHDALREAPLGPESVSCPLGSFEHAPPGPRDQGACGPGPGERARPPARQEFGCAPETRGDAHAASSMADKCASSLFQSEKGRY